MKSTKIFSNLKKYIWLILCIFWSLYAFCSSYSEVWHVCTNDDVYTIANSSAYDSETDTVYVIDDDKKTGYVYAINSDNDVTALFDASSFAKGTYLDLLCYEDGRIYALIFSETYQGDLAVKAYLLVELDPLTLEAVGRSNWFTTYEPVQMTKLSKDDSFLYMAGVSDDDTKAEVYVLPCSDIIPVTDDDDFSDRIVSTIRYSAVAEPSEGYHLVYAEYVNGELRTLENGKGLQSESVYNPFVKERFENKNFTFAQKFEINKTQILATLFIILIGDLFILAMYFLVKKRNRVAYLIVLWESILAFVLFFSSYSIYSWNKDLDMNDLLYFATYSLDDIRDELDELEDQYLDNDDYYQSEEYQNLSERLRRVVFDYADGDIFTNLLHISEQDGKYHVVAAARGLDNCQLEEIYGPEAPGVIEELHDTGSYGKINIKIDGVEYYLVCVGAEDEAEPTSLLIAVITAEVAEAFYLLNIALVFFAAICLFVLGSIVGVYILLRQSRDLRLLGNTMLEVSQGGIGIEKPDTLGEDMSDMWSGLLDIDRSFKNLNYIKYRTFESYYRFAPKSVEKLLDKTSITEVISGDVVRKKGTIVLLETDTINMLKDLAKSDNAIGSGIMGAKAVEVLETISKHQEEGRMFKISGTSDFSEMQLLMPESTVNATSIGTELSKIYSVEGHKACMFMHFTSYLYGVAIAGAEASQFLLSKDIIMVRDHIKILNKLGICQVITNTVYDREIEKPNCRYIGYWKDKSVNKIDLYEVLEAYDDETRRHREETKAIFEEGLQFFYDGNFNMARNSFARVLKMDYEDTVARWYLFTSENFIDGSGNKKDYSLSE